ncbi:putative inactive glutathione hydrolase 4 isoform X2 [Vicia villosa]|uniref:putative inactive glutathione hydrolase 4 isoform X2 n=1 Tax=Vicia villosa TaxID=3911 RepID=UPI00273C7F1F|nr:putative inactive glutathione hydrolase 4 isoform X2 [Vicia villosa]
MPPPSGGPPLMLVSLFVMFFVVMKKGFANTIFLLLQLLNILAQYEFPSGLSGALGIHREIEALKHVFVVRMNLGDPDFVNITKVLSDMLSTKFARVLRIDINDNRTYSSSHYGGKWNQIKDHGTSHLSIINSERNAVSMSATVNEYFGAKILSPSTGIVLNNEMNDFFMPVNASKDVPAPAPANFIAPGKRPLSSMTPIIALKDGKVKAVVGASGGIRIIAATSEVLLNHFVKGMDPFSSVTAPRVYYQLIPNVVDYENWTTVNGDHFKLSDNIRASLRRKGHVLQGLVGGTICQLIVSDISEHPGRNKERGWYFHVGSSIKDRNAD